MTVGVKPLLIFLHGFNSGGGSNKASFLRDNMPDFEHYSPDLPYEPDAAIALLANTIEAAIVEGRDVALVGSSMGGFYAEYLAARYGLASVLINPLVDQSLLRYKIGPQQNYYTGETYLWSEADCMQLDRMVVPFDRISVPPLLLLDKADELLDAAFAMRHFEGHAEVHLFEGGSHRFDHMAEALPLIRDYLTRSAAGTESRT